MVLIQHLNNSANHEKQVLDWIVGEMSHKKRGYWMQCTFKATVHLLSGDCLFIYKEWFSLEVILQFSELPCSSTFLGIMLTTLILVWSIYIGNNSITARWLCSQLNNWANTTTTDEIEFTWQKINSLSWFALVFFCAFVSLLGWETSLVWFKTFFSEIALALLACNMSMLLSQVNKSLISIKVTAMRYIIYCLVFH